MDGALKVHATGAWIVSSINFEVQRVLPLMSVPCDWDPVGRGLTCSAGIGRTLSLRARRFLQVQSGL